VRGEHAPTVDTRGYAIALWPAGSRAEPGDM
jgi:hypothetical protein